MGNSPAQKNTQHHNTIHQEKDTDTNVLYFVLLLMSLIIEAFWCNLQATQKIVTTTCVLKYQMLLAS
jgi:hypothetical protein